MNTHAAKWWSLVVLLPALAVADPPAPTSTASKPAYDLSDREMRKFLRRPAVKPDTPAPASLGQRQPAAKVADAARVSPAAVDRKKSVVECQDFGCVGYDARGNALYVEQPPVNARSLHQLLLENDTLRACLDGNNMLAMFERCDALNSGVEMRLVGLPGQPLPKDLRVAP